MSPSLHYHLSGFAVFHNAILLEQYDPEQDMMYLQVDNLDVSK